MKLPILSGKDLIKVFERLGYEVVRQKGSHVRLCHKSDKSKKILTVPLHQTVGKGLLRKILRDAEISTEKLGELL